MIPCLPLHFQEYFAHVGAHKCVSIFAHSPLNCSSPILLLMHSSPFQRHLPHFLSQLHLYPCILFKIHSEKCIITCTCIKVKSCSTATSKMCKSWTLHSRFLKNLCLFNEVIHHILWKIWFMSQKCKPGAVKQPNLLVLFITLSPLIFQNLCDNNL